MKKYKVAYVLFFLTAFAFADVRENARLIDLMMEHQEETLDLVDLAQERSTNLELKKLFRKVGRNEKRELKKMNQWRSGYFEDIPYTVEWRPAPDRADLQEVEGSEFDLRLLDHMIEQRREEIRLYKDFQDKGDRKFMYEFARKGLKQLDKEIEKMQSLKAEILGRT